MLDDIYNQRILELAASIPRLGRLDDPHGRSTAHSRLCGSTVTCEVRITGETVIDFAQEVKACALGQASSSVLARHVIGRDLAELRALREAMRRMLKENGPPPGGVWADLRVLEPVREYRARHASTLLPFDAVIGAIEQALARAGAPA